VFNRVWSDQTGSRVDLAKLLVCIRAVRASKCRISQNREVRETGIILNRLHRAKGKFGKKSRFADLREIDVALGQFETQSVLSLVACAADSPSCGHRLASLTLLWTRALSQSNGGDLVADAPDLGRLLELVHKTCPEIMRLEDTWNADPRAAVGYRIGRERLRIHPGAASDPTQLLRTMDATALAIDDFILERFGFAFSDLIEASMRYSDWIISHVAPSWPDGQLERDRLDPVDEDLEARAMRISSSPAILQQSELDHRRTLSTEPVNWLSKCSNSNRATEAWNWATSPSRSVEMTFSQSGPQIGPYLAFSGGQRSHPVPAALILEGLMSAHSILANEASRDLLSRRAMDIITIRRTLEVFRIELASGDSMQDESAPSPSGMESSLEFGVSIRPNGVHSFDIAVASGLSESETSASVARAHGRIASLASEGSTENSQVTEGEELHRRIVVYGGPIYLKPASKPGPTQIHVEDLAMIRLDAQQMEHGHDLLFQFLDELATMPGLEEFLFVEFSDIWRHWKRHGSLNYTGMSEIVLMADIRQNDESWVTAAVWEPIEVILAASDLPPVLSWPNAYRKDESQALLEALNGSQYTILVDPPVVIRHVMDNELCEMGIDPAFVTGIVDGIALTIKNFPEIAKAMRMQSGTPLRIELEFVGQRPQFATDDVIVFGSFTSNDPYPLVSIQLGPDWFETLNESPQEAHLGLGHIFFHCLSEIRESERGWVSNNEGFLAEWESAPPVAMLRLQETPLRARNMGRSVLPRTLGSLGRARRALATKVVESDAPTGLFYGSAAIDVCKSVIIPACDRALEKLMADWSAKSIIEISGHLNDAHAERARAEASLSVALSAPWEKAWRDHAMSSPEPSEMTRPLELLLELSTARDKFGTLDPDRYSVAEATDLALIGLSFGAALSGAVKGLHDLSATVRPGGICGVAAIPAPISRYRNSSTGESQRSSEFDVEAYMRTRRLHQLRLRSTVDGHDKSGLHLGQDPSVSPSPFVLFESLEVPATLTKANQAMIETCGTGFNGIIAVLSTAGAWRSETDRVDIVPRSSLRQEASAWASLTLDEVDAALDRLVLTKADLLSDGIRYWEVENRRIRIATRPLVQIGDDIVLIPWQIDATKRVYATYMQDGRLPWHASETPDRVRRELNQYRTIQNRLLEKEAAQKATSLCMPNALNVFPHRALEFGLSIPGEVDLIVADLASSRIWVCEIKDVHSSFSASRMQRRVEKFTKSKIGFFDKLDSRYQAVCENIRGALDLLGVPSEDVGGWTVEPVIVTREIEPAAFVPDVPVTFCLLDDLDQLLRLNGRPSPGYGWMIDW
jgi:hypothetical protein